jgi:hypothetical protein
MIAQGFRGPSTSNMTVNTQCRLSYAHAERDELVGVPVELVAPVVALAIVVAGMQFAVAITDAIRTRLYRTFEDQSLTALEAEFLIPTFDDSQAEQRRRAYSPDLTEVHNRTNALQTGYHNAVARSTGALVVAFLGLVLGTLPADDWQSLNSLVDEKGWAELLLSWVDASAIILVLVLFLYARKVNPSWIAARSGAELLRQAQFLCVIFPDPDLPDTSDGLRSYVGSERDSIEARVGKGDPDTIVARIEAIWSDAKSAIIDRPPVDSRHAADALQVYLRRRVRRQLGWFQDSQARLESIAERRNGLLLTLYASAAALALAKLALALRGEELPGFLVPLLLTVTGLSAALTAYYINQNSRSLIHRYHAQARRIRTWLHDFDAEWPFKDLASMSFDRPTYERMRARILWFEDLMIEELVDWIHISSSDAVELAP